MSYGVLVDETLRIYIDVEDCLTYDLQLTNDFIYTNNAFNNVVGVYFENATGDIIPNSAICLYPYTKGGDVDENSGLWPTETYTVNVPAGAMYMGYWLHSDAAAWKNGRIDYQRGDVFDIRKDGVVPQLFSTRVMHTQHNVWYDDRGMVLEYKNEIPVGTRMPTSVFADAVKLSDPAHNPDNVVWMIRENDGSVLIEDYSLGGVYDFGIWWTRPRSICDFGKHPGCNPTVEVVEPQEVTQNQAIDIQRIIPVGEGQVPDPLFISEESSPTMTIQKDGEIFVTFVMEGAGYKNKFGYYTYDPITNEINKKVVIWENASALNSGGDLVRGDTVSLGKFRAGTHIGWWLQADGFNRPDHYTYYSHTEKNPDGKRHIAVGIDPYSGRIVVGFEDLYNLGDKDFNDMVFYVTGDPIDTIDYTTIAIGDPSNDQTGQLPTSEVDEQIIQFHNGA